MSESSVTIGSLTLTLVFTLVILTILSPLATSLGVFNPTLNATSPQGQYLAAAFGSNGILPFINTSLNVNFIPHATSSANQSLNAISPSSLAQTSGFAFIAGGFSLLGSSLWNFPRFIWVMLTESFGYGGIGKFLPFAIAGIIASATLAYLSIMIAYKITSIISKPGQSIENI